MKPTYIYLGEKRPDISGLTFPEVISSNLTKLELLTGKDKYLNLVDTRVGE